MTSKNAFSSCCGIVSAVALLVAGSAEAGIVSITGNALLIAPPASVVVNSGLESDTTAFIFTEQTDLVLGALAPVNITSPGLYNSNASLTPGAIAAGADIDSFYYHSDPIGSDANNSRSYDVAITFSTEVLGIAVLDGRLNATNFLGAPGTLYSANGQGLELGAPDTVTLSADRLTVTIHNVANTAADDIRIITVPEPATLALLGLGLAGLAAARRRQR